jgi:3-oxoacyl-[acyl-carrier-protein] synthase-1
MSLMRPVYCISSNVTASPGLDTDAVWNAVVNGSSGVQWIEDAMLYPRGIWASRLNAAQWASIESGVQNSALSPLEQMGIFSVKEALAQCDEDADFSKTLFIFTTTKGNIEWLGKQPDARNRLTTSAGIIAQSIGIETKPVVISHACVSGVSGLIYALRALENGRFDTAIITGADRLSKFVISGFDSFHAMADERCRPFDASRKGINLGEGAATIILAANPRKAPLARLCGGAMSNDANHISGPSRTGEELAQAIGKALASCGLSGKDVDAISAHGTATMYNDEMESKAFALAGVLHVPLNSLKGYVGHTLGAAGVLECAMLIESIRRGQTIASAGFETLGVSQPVNVTMQSTPADIRHALKTASGFGGCNAAVVWSKV